MAIRVISRTFWIQVVNSYCIKSIRIRSYSGRMRKNADQNNSKYGHSASVERKRSRTLVTEDVKTVDTLNSSFIKTFIPKLNRRLHLKTVARGHN